MSSDLNFLLLHPAIGVFLSVLPAVVGGLALILGGRAPTMGWAVRVAGVLLILLSVTDVSGWFVTGVAGIAFLEQFSLIQSIASILFTVGAMGLFLIAIARSGKAEQRSNAAAPPVSAPTPPVSSPGPGGYNLGPGGPSVPDPGAPGAPGGGYPGGPPPGGPPPRP